jgi:hypothetical protein
MMNVTNHIKQLFGQSIRSSIEPKEHASGTEHPTSEEMLENPMNIENSLLDMQQAKENAQDASWCPWWTS